MQINPYKCSSSNPLRTLLQVGLLNTSKHVNNTVATYN